MEAIDIRALGRTVRCCWSRTGQPWGVLDLGRQRFQYDSGKFLLENSGIT